MPFASWGNKGTHHFAVMSMSLLFFLVSVCVLVYLPYGRGIVPLAEILLILGFPFFSHFTQHTLYLLIVGVFVCVCVFFFWGGSHIVGAPLFEAIRSRSDFGHGWWDGCCLFVMSTWIGQCLVAKVTAVLFG